MHTPAQKVSEGEQVALEPAATVQIRLRVEAAHEVRSDIAGNAAHGVA